MVLTKKTLTLGKIILASIAIAMIIGIAYLGQVADKSRENAREMIKNYGKEVECRLTYKYETESNRIHHYFLVFDIQYNDSLIELESQSFDFDWEDFEKAIIGLKYKALVILEGENKFKYSKILLSQLKNPIPKFTRKEKILNQDIKVQLPLLKNMDEQERTWMKSGKNIINN